MKFHSRDRYSETLVNLPIGLPFKPMQPKDFTRARGKRSQYPVELSLDCSLKQAVFLGGRTACIDITKKR